MRSIRSNNVGQWGLCLGILTMAVCSSGCISFSQHAVPAARLPSQYQAPTKCGLHPINFQLLAKRQVNEHFIDAGDFIAVTVVGVLPNAASHVALVPNQTTLNSSYYPPNGTINGPSFGVPTQVQADGTMQLPQIPSIKVNGLTLKAAAQKIADAYVEEDVLKEKSAQVNLVLLRSRVNRVVVLREDASLESAQLISKGQTTLHKRGSAMLIDLPYHESDVLHALAGSGGLPGVDAYNEIWVLRSSTISDEERASLRKDVEQGTLPADAIRKLPAHVLATRIPLKMCANESIQFSQSDVELHPGDVVYVEPRKDEYFYTGGLLPGGQILLPRDEDIDVVEAIAIASGSVGGLGGTSSVAVLRAGAGLGNIIPPTRVLVLRKLPNGQQLPIRVDLNLAMKDPKERIKIMSGDYIMMYYKPGETASNAVLNFFNINLSATLN